MSGFLCRLLIFGQHVFFSSSRQYGSVVGGFFPSVVGSGEVEGLRTEMANFRRAMLYLHGE